jgi:hypothetical protein
VPVGRPSKYTPEVQERICQLIRAGNTVDVAARAVGLNAALLYKWMQRRPRFKAAIETARGEAEAILVGRVQKAASAGSWRAACWLLERQWPERWAPLSERSRIDKELDRELQKILAE